MILEVNNINTYYGTSHILFDVSLQVSSGELVCLLGRNGAGKTTTMRSIMGLTPPKSGSVKFHGEDIVGKPPYTIAQKGMGYVPDNRLIFPDLTVRQNLEIAIKKSDHFKGEPWTVDRIYEIFPKLKVLDKHLGGYLSGGEQQMLTLGRTLMGNPELILLDEPVEGLAPLVVKDFAERLLKLKEIGVTILFSEQNIKFSLSIADRAYVIDKGRIRYHGTIKELSENEEVKRNYLMI
ncbi:MAG: ABC transporter ATP-binding protein [Syntrophorhabdaceae bacterium]|nr:ABC transporter ATP-binding protein [Syntrophorhabdaceae bacterium]